MIDILVNALDAYIKLCENEKDSGIPVGGIQTSVRKCLKWEVNEMILLMLLFMIIEGFSPEGIFILLFLLLMALVVLR